MSGNVSHTFHDEGTIAGIRYVTVIDAGGNPIEYNVEWEYAVAEYGEPE